MRACPHIQFLFPFSVYKLQLLPGWDPSPYAQLGYSQLSFRSQLKIFLQFCFLILKEDLIMLLTIL